VHLEHTGSRTQAMSLDLVELRVGEERHHRLAARLLSLVHSLVQDGRREVEVHVAHLRRGHALRRQRPEIRVEERRDAVNR
jgi:hypothetical protein